MAITPIYSFKFLLNFPEGEYPLYTPWWKFKSKDVLEIEHNGPMTLLIRRYNKTSTKARRDICFEFDEHGRLITYMHAVGRIWRVLWQYGEFHPIYYVEAHDLSIELAESLKKSIKKYGFPNETIG